METYIPSNYQFVVSELKLNAAASVFVPKQSVKNDFKTLPKDIVKEHLKSNLR
jgi:hypothetical protein